MLCCFVKQTSILNNNINYKSTFIVQFYVQVTAKPDLYPLVIGYDDTSGKGTSGFVMRYFRSLSHASTLDSLSSSFMCNVVNEANTIIPPPYSCNNSVDELSAAECERRETGDVGSVVSLTNHRTTSDISSLAAQSPCSPPRATSPTIEVHAPTLQQINLKINLKTIKYIHEIITNSLTKIFLIIILDGRLIIKKYV